MISMQYIVTGRVQGVGFRYHVQRIATEFPITGFVRNQSDGGVLIVAQGDHDILDAFINSVQKPSNPYMRIDAIDQKELHLDKHYKDFSISYA